MMTFLIIFGCLFGFGCLLGAVYATIRHGIPLLVWFVTSFPRDLISSIRQGWKEGITEGEQILASRDNKTN